MDKHLNNIETQLQEFIDTKDFSELTPSEKNLVLKQMTQEEYQLQRDIIQESAYLYDDNKKVVVPPLIPTNASKSFWFKSHPIYQTGIAVAATILIMWFIKFPKDEFVKPETEVKYVSQTDTLIQTQTEYIYDTVYEVVEKPVIVEKTTYIEVPVSGVTSTTNTEEPKRMLNPSGPYPISTKGIEETSTSSSFSDDETAVLVQDFILTD